MLGLQKGAVQLLSKQRQIGSAQLLQPHITCTFHRDKRDDWNNDYILMSSLSPQISASLFNGDGLTVNTFTQNLRFQGHGVKTVVTMTESKSSCFTWNSSKESGGNDSKNFLETLETIRNTHLSTGTAMKMLMNLAEDSLSCADFSFAVTQTSAP